MDATFTHESSSEARDVQTRDELAQYLSLSLPGDYRRVTGDGEVRSTATYVKSYLVEAHRDGDRSLTERLRDVFGNVAPLRDKTLVRAFDKDDAYFVDLGHPRIQVLHSVGKTDRTDQVLERLTEGDASGFDHAWLPGSFLHGIRRGQLTGFKFRFRTAVGGVVAVDPADVDLETGEIRRSVRGRSRVTMTLAEDADAEREFSRFMRQDAFRGRKALEQVQFRAGDEDNPADHIVDGIYANGKVIGKGTSIGGHFLTVDGVVDAYARVLDKIEEGFGLGWVPSGDGHVLRGGPFVVAFPPDVEIIDLHAFTESLFRSTKPFRLFGIPHSATDDRIDVEAIDLHTGDPLSVELTREWMRIFLPRGSCGNVIARLYSNLQHSLSSDVRLTVGDGLDPFDLRAR